MTNQTSIKYLSGLLENPVSLTDGDQNSIALFRQSFPYFVPVRYLAALEAHKKSPFSASMMSGLEPYMGNWILLCDFLEDGTDETKIAAKIETKVETKVENKPLIVENSAPLVLPAEGSQEDNLQISEEKKKAGNTSAQFDQELRMNRKQRRQAMYLEQKRANTLPVENSVNMEEELTPLATVNPANVVAPPIINEQPEPVITPTISDIPLKLESIVADAETSIQNAPLTLPTVVNKAQEEMQARIIPELQVAQVKDTEIRIPGEAEETQQNIITPGKVVEAENWEEEKLNMLIQAAAEQQEDELAESSLKAGKIGTNEVAQVEQVNAGFGLAPGKVKMDEDFPATVIAASNEYMGRPMQMIPVRVNMELENPIELPLAVIEKTGEPQQPRPEAELPVEEVVKESIENIIPVPVAEITEPIQLQMPETENEPEPETLLEHEIISEPVMESKEQLGIDLSEPEVIIESETSVPEVETQTEIEEPAIEEEINEEPVLYAETGELEIIDEPLDKTWQEIKEIAEPEIEEPVLTFPEDEEAPVSGHGGQDEGMNKQSGEVGETDLNNLIYPVYAEDYFLHQGVKVSKEIPDEITELKGIQTREKALMVMMSFSEWLLHFRNTSEKQKEEKKDQKSLKTMWQKEKLAAAMEEENEEIPENVFEMAVNSITREDGLASESLADIYIKQKKYDKAIEMYRKLSLRNPKKNAYFAAKIEAILKEKLT